MVTYYLKADSATDVVAWETTPNGGPSSHVLQIDRSTFVISWKVALDAPAANKSILSIDDATDVISWSPIS